MNKLFLAKGKLRVEAKGYWFTSGGEKGSFGYYPHLKDRQDYPVFSDTQVHGDLRMAAEWLKNIKVVSEPQYINLVFGITGNDASAMLRITDLELSAESKKQWRRERFQVKPRIQINDITRIAEKHMLADHELSYLENIVLESEIYLGYFANENDLKESKGLLEKAAGFLSGFGGFRSRGYGRGKVSVKWDEESPEISITGRNIDKKKKKTDSLSILYFLTALVNFRNKPVELGSSQSIDSADYISAGQLRGWFVRMYQAVFGLWPSVEEIAGIYFSDLYLSHSKSAGYPRPMTTLKYENNEIKDIWGRTRNDAEREQQENMFNTKSKPLPAGTFVTNEPAVLSIRKEKRKRIRNSIKGNFVTDEKGLFVQELIEKGEIFGGLVRIEQPESEFAQRAWSILTGVNPIINGAIFKPFHRRPGTVVPVSDIKPFLVTSPLPFNEKYFQSDSSKEPNRIMLSVDRRFNTTLKRPRRNRIVIAPSSVLSDAVKDKTVQWSGFGETVPKPPEVSETPKVPKMSEVKASLSVIEISRSQAGFLREFLKPDISEEFIEQILTDRIDKAEQKNKDKLKNLLTKIQTYLKSGDVEGMKSFIRNYLEELHINWWKETHGKKHGNDKS